MDARAHEDGAGQDQGDEGAITFSADGTFSTSKVDATTEVQAKDGPMQMTGHMTAQGSGQWSATDGKLSLGQATIDAKGTMQLKGLAAS